MLHVKIKMSDLIKKVQEGLFVKSLIQHAQPDHALSYGRPSSGDQPVVVSWHRFLDELCHLCQFKRGGDDITAMAAQQRQNGTVFWIATNTGIEPESDEKRQNRRRHLTWIVRTISTQNGWSQSQAQSNASELVFAEAVRQAPQRIENYRHRLSSLVKMIQDELENGNERGKVQNLPDFPRLTSKKTSLS